MSAGQSPQRPQRPDWTIDQGWADYTAEEHAVWKTLFERQSALLPGRACDAFVDGMQKLPIGAEQIPDFRALSAVLMQTTGWQVVAVPGLVPDDVFFDHLAHRRFPAGHFIRKPHELDYLEEPDVFHDVFGHVPMLMNPVMADYIQAYGQGGLRAKALGVLDKLARVSGTPSNLGWCSRPTASVSSVRASRRRSPKRCLRWTTRHPTASALTWSG